MKIRSRMLSSLVVFLFVVSCGSAESKSPAPVYTETQTPIPTPTPITITPAYSTSTATDLTRDELHSKLQAVLQPWAEADKLSGVVLVASQGQVMFNQAYGLADVENKLLNSVNTKFHLGSLSKQFTATAILLLQQQGKLNVQDLICNYVDDCPSAWAPITIHELLIHTSGIHEFNDTPGVEKLIDQRVTPVQIVNQFRDLPLDFVPGEKYSYSNSGYMLLGVIIEKASGQTYGDFVQQAIFDPLQMKNSGYEDDDSTGPEYASGYKTRDTPAIFVDKSINFSSAGLYSTAEDLLLWEQSFYTEALLPASTLREMFTAYIPVPNSTLTVGYGWFIGMQYGQAWFYNGSQSPGFSTMLHSFPASRITIIVLTNRQDTDVKGLNALIGPVIFGGPWESPTK